MYKNKLNHHKDKKIISMIKPNTSKSVLYAKGGTLVEAGKYSDAYLNKALSKKKRK